MTNSPIPEQPEPHWKDYAYAIVKGAVSSVPIPIAAGIAAEVLSLIIVPPVEKRRNEWMSNLVRGLVELQEKVGGFSLEALSENEVFITTTLHAAQAAMRNHQAEKLAALRNAVLNSALPNAPEDDLQQIFIILVDELTTWHLRILKLMDYPKKAVGDKSFGSVENLLLHVFPDLQGKYDFYSKIGSDLHSRGLASIPLRTMMTPQGVLSPRSTTIGKQFLRFISTPPNLSPANQDD